MCFTRQQCFRWAEGNEPGTLPSGSRHIRSTPGGAQGFLGFFFWLKVKTSASQTDSSIQQFVKTPGILKLVFKVYLNGQWRSAKVRFHPFIYLSNQPSIHPTIWHPSILFTSSKSSWFRICPDNSFQSNEYCLCSVLPHPNSETFNILAFFTDVCRDVTAECNRALFNKLSLSQIDSTARCRLWSFLLIGEGGNGNQSILELYWTLHLKAQFPQGSFMFQTRCVYVLNYRFINPRLFLTRPSTLTKSESTPRPNWRVKVRVW